MNPIVVFILRLLLIALSYSFIGWIVYLIYKDLKQHLRRSKEPPANPIALATDEEEKVFHIPEIILGRDLACEFPILDDAVSLRHCNLTYHHTRWWIEDLNSTNGSYLNNALIKAPTVLTDGDIIKLGLTSIAIKLT